MGNRWVRFESDLFRQKSASAGEGRLVFCLVFFIHTIHYSHIVTHVLMSKSIAIAVKSHSRHSVIQKYSFHANGDLAQSEDALTTPVPFRSYSAFDSVKF